MKTKSEIEAEIGKKIVFEKTFVGDGDTFSAYSDACAYLDKLGIGHGSMERHNPIGLERNADIAKWTNLVGQGWNDRLCLDGAMVSESFREKPVTVFLSFNPEEEK